MQKLEMSTVRVANIHLVRTKKLKGGRKVIRSIRTIPLHHLKHTVTGNQHSTKMVVDFDHKYGAGQMIGEVDKSKGVVNFGAKAFIPAGYLKGRGFELTGYNLRTWTTNTGRKG